ncbi:MAG: hypothetical protein P4M14_05205 [Gammaproteobacteria bacterium]|nr:hypothetical protein [Gammaproteobacteria bacterium]
MINGRPITLSVSEPEEPIVIAQEEMKESTYQKPQQDAASDLRVVKKLTSGARENVNFIHDVFIARRSVDGEEQKENLFLKDIIENDMTSTENKVEARVEVMGQRYVRMGDLNQPCSRYVFDEVENRHMVSSVEVPGFRAFAEIPKNEIRQNILSGKFKGAGRKFFWRWALDDYDFNLSNVGVDKDNNVIILDGGWYLGTRYANYPNKITQKDFQEFPWLTDFKPDFFLDHIRKFKDKATKKKFRVIGEGEIICPEMTTNKQFRHDFFEGVLQFIIMPDVFTTQFALMHLSDSAMMAACDQSVHIVEDYIQPEFQRDASKVGTTTFAYSKTKKTSREVNEYQAAIKEYQDADAGLTRTATKIGQLLLDRKKQMRTVALECRDFRRYLRSAEARQDLENYIASLKKYEKVDQDAIFSYVPHLEQFIRDAFSALQLVNEETQILCQKITRMADVTKPNTRFIRNEAGNTPSISIAPVGGLTLFSDIDPKDINYNLLCGEYRGAGAQLFWKWALDDYDCGLENIGVDENGKVVALEAGVYLGKSVRFYNNKITLKDFEAFPLMEDFDPKYWLDHINYHKDSQTDIITKRKGEGSILSVQLTQHPQFKREYFEAVLQFLLLPDTFFYAVSLATHQHVAEQLAEKIGLKAGPNGPEATSKKRAEMLIARRNQMQVVALQSKKFNEYLKSAASNADFDKYLSSIEQFVADDEDKVIPSFPDLIKTLKDKFIELRTFHVNELKRYNNANQVLNPSKSLHDRYNPDQPFFKYKLDAIAEQDERDVLPVVADLEEKYVEEEKQVVDVPKLPEQDLPIKPIALNPQPEPMVVRGEDEVIAPLKALEPKADSLWRSMIKGAISTLFAGALITTGLMAYGLLTVATLGANAILTVAIATAVTALGGLAGLVVADQQLIEDKQEDLSIMESPEVPPLEEAAQPAVVEEVAEQKHQPVMCPPLVPFYRAESAGSAKDISLEGDNFDAALVAHEVATLMVINENNERDRQHKSKQFGLPEVVVVPAHSDLHEIAAKQQRSEEGHSVQLRI